jgi:hypothetical protein
MAADEDRIRQEMVPVFVEALAAGGITTPSLMNDEGRRQFPGIVREALASGNATALFRALANDSLWTMYAFGFSLMGSGMQPTDWLPAAKQVADATWTYCYRTALSRLGVDSEAPPEDQPPRTTAES